jgi:hypothetical protein
VDYSSTIPYAIMVWQATFRMSLDIFHLLLQSLLHCLFKETTTRQQTEVQATELNTDHTSVPSTQLYL